MSPISNRCFVSLYPVFQLYIHFQGVEAGVVLTWISRLGSDRKTRRLDRIALIRIAV